MICKNCGEKIQDGSKFCNKCGIKIALDEPNCKIVLNQVNTIDNGGSAVGVYIFLSCFFGAIIGAIASLFYGATGFFMCFIITAILIFMYMMFTDAIDRENNEKFSKYNLKSKWEENNHNFNKTVNEMAEVCGMDRTKCENYICKEFIKEVNVYETYIANDCDSVVTIKSIYEHYPINKNFIQRKVSEVEKSYKKEQAEINKLIVKNTSGSYNNKESNLASNKATYNLKEREPLSLKKQYKANKKAGIVTCPKCGSTSITTTNKKISAGKGVVGAAVGSMVNPLGTVVGAAVGATHSKKIYNVCMNCGHKWKP